MRRERCACCPSPDQPDERSSEGWIEFDAPLELMTWGRNVYVVLFLDERLDRAAAEERTRRVEGRVDEVEVNLGINKADVADAPFLYVGTALRGGWGHGPATSWRAGCARPTPTTSRCPTTYGRPWSPPAGSMPSTACVPPSAAGSCNRSTTLRNQQHDNGVSQHSSGHFPTRDFRISADPHTDRGRSGRA